MSTIPVQESTSSPPTLSPWDVVSAAEWCFRFLQGQFDPFGPSYSIKRDQLYRDYREIVVTGLGELECFQDARINEDDLPRSLANFGQDSMFWELFLNHRLQSLLDNLLTAVDAAGVPRPDVPGPASVRRTTNVNTSHEAETLPSRPPAQCDKATTHATRRLAENRVKARQLRGNGMPVRLIAERLRKSERTIYTYLNRQET
jgi:hypothetical protein